MAFPALPTGSRCAAWRVGRRVRDGGHAAHRRIDPRHLSRRPWDAEHISKSARSASRSAPTPSRPWLRPSRGSGRWWRTAGTVRARRTEGHRGRGDQCRRRGRRRGIGDRLRPQHLGSKGPDGDGSPSRGGAGVLTPGNARRKDNDGFAYRRCRRRLPGGDVDRRQRVAVLTSSTTAGRCGDDHLRADAGLGGSGVSIMCIGKASCLPRSWRVGYSPPTCSDPARRTPTPCLRRGGPVHPVSDAPVTAAGARQATSYLLGRRAHRRHHGTAVVLAGVLSGGARRMR